MIAAVRKARWTALGVAGAGCALLAVSYAHPHRAEVLPRFGGLALILVAGLIHFRADAGVLWRELVRAAQRAHEERAHLLVLALIVLAAVAVRVQFIDEPMRTDESYTFLRFAARPLDVALVHYEVPNNHLFHTLLVHFSWVAFGEDPPALRLPAFVAGVAVAPAAYLAGRALYDRNAALLAAGLVVPSGALVEYSVNARGYTIVCVAFLLVLALGAYLIAHPNPVTWIVWVAIAAAALYTIPIMVFGLAIAAGWMGMRIRFEAPRQRRWALYRDLLLALTGAGLAALALYVPTLNQPGWSLERTAHWSLLRQVWDSWNAGIPPPVRVVLAAGAVAAVALHRRIGRQRLSVAAGLAALPVALLVVSRVPTEARRWVFLEPLYLVLAAAGLVALMRLAAPRATPALAAGLAIASAAGLGLAFHSSDLPNAADPPLRDGDRAARFLKARLRLGDRVVVSALTAQSFRYYFHHVGLLPTLIASGIDWSPRRGDRVVLIVSRVRRETLAGTLQRLHRDQADLRAPQLMKAYGWISLYELKL